MISKGAFQAQQILWLVISRWHPILREATEKVQLPSSRGTIWCNTSSINCLHPWALPKPHISTWVSPQPPLPNDFWGCFVVCLQRTTDRWEWKFLLESKKTFRSQSIDFHIGEMYRTILRQCRRMPCIARIILVLKQLKPTHLQVSLSFGYWHSKASDLGTSK